MRDYRLHAVASRSAKVGDKLVTTAQTWRVQSCNVQGSWPTRSQASVGAFDFEGGQPMRIGRNSGLAISCLGLAIFAAVTEVGSARRAGSAAHRLEKRREH